nr:MAG TPA: hypothetical protein [Bacteriophage sp.]DAX09338.1 MAG TPA: hypothetical protein [Bacteriophage sp.]
MIPYVTLRYPWYYRDYRYLRVIVIITNKPN